MTTPRLAVATESGRYYADPNPAYDGALYPSVTNIIDTVVNKTRLVPWSAEIAAAYAMNHLDDLVGADKSPKARSAMIKQITAQAGTVRDDAADLGTRVHDAVDAHNLGLPTATDAEVAPFLAQYRRFLDEWSVNLTEDLEASEVSVVHRGYGYAGTLDLLLWLRSGPRRARELWLIDGKSSISRPATNVYESHVLQLAALRHAQTAWLPSGFEAPMPMADRTGVLNLRRGTFALMEVEADQDAFGAFLSAIPTARWLHSKGQRVSATRIEAPSFAERLGELNFTDRMARKEAA